MATAHRGMVLTWDNHAQGQNTFWHTSTAAGTHPTHASFLVVIHTDTMEEQHTRKLPNNDNAQATAQMTGAHPYTCEWWWDDIRGMIAQSQMGQKICSNTHLVDKRGVRKQTSPTLIEVEDRRMRQQEEWGAEREVGGGEQGGTKKKKSKVATENKNIIHYYVFWILCDLRTKHDLIKYAGM